MSSVNRVRRQMGGAEEIEMNPLERYTLDTLKERAYLNRLRGIAVSKELSDEIARREALTVYAVYVNGPFGGYKMLEREGSHPPVQRFATIEAAEAEIEARGFINSTEVRRDRKPTAYVISTEERFL